MTRVPKIGDVHVGPSQGRKRSDVTGNLFEHPLLLANGACNIALLTEHLTTIEVSWPIQRPVSKQPTQLFVSDPVVAIEVAILDRPTEGGRVGSELPEGVIQFTTDEFLAPLEQVDQSEDRMGASTAWIVFEGPPCFAFRYVIKARLVDLPFRILATT